MRLRSTPIPAPPPAGGHPRCARVRGVSRPLCRPSGGAAAAYLGGKNSPLEGYVILYPTPRTVVITSSPSFWRRALTCMSTVRVSPV